MMASPEAFYDSDDVRAEYLRHRARSDNPNDTLERPVFLEMAGDLTGLDIVDLGCGDAAFGREALEHGAASYRGFDASEQMASAGRQRLEGLNGHIEHQSIEQWRADPASADLVTSRLALNYVENLDTVFHEVTKALRPGGRVAISVEHPVITSSFTSLADGRRTTWLVDDYFLSGPRPHEWLGHTVVKYHRTLEEWLDLMLQAGLVLEQLRESRPARENFRSEDEYERRLRIPLFLFLAARTSA